MGRSESGLYKRKQQKRRNEMKKMKNLKSLLQNERSANKQIRKDLKDGKIELATIVLLIIENITSTKNTFL